MRIVWLSLAAVALVLGTNGCTKLYAVRISPNTHYVPADATVRELGPVKARMTHGFSLLFFPDPDLETAELEERLFGMALNQQVGANVILNYALAARIRNVPMLFSWGEMDIEGTGAQIIPGGRPGAVSAR